MFLLAMDNFCVTQTPFLPVHTTYNSFSLPPPATESLQLTEPQSYHYLNQSGCVSDPTIDDVSDFARVSQT